MVFFLFQLANDLCSAYRTAYYETTREMEQNSNEKRWDCSEIFIFTKLNTFELRLNKVIGVWGLGHFTEKLLTEKVGKVQRSYYCTSFSN
jgi:hypothetical protein